MVGIPILPPMWSPLLVDVEGAAWTVEGKGGHLRQPSLPGSFVLSVKSVHHLSPRGPFIESLLGGPPERMQRCSGHTSLSAHGILPNSAPSSQHKRSIAKRGRPGN